MIYLSGTIWASPAQTLVKTVNVDIPLPNLQKEGDNRRVRFIEEDFHRLIWDVDNV